MKGKSSEEGAEMGGEGQVLAEREGRRCWSSSQVPSPPPRPQPPGEALSQEGGLSPGQLAEAPERGRN